MNSKEALQAECPWGNWEILNEEKSYKIKKISVLPGHRLSYQSHNHRSELWMIIHGKAEITLDDEKIFLEQGQHLYIPQKSRHRIANPQKDTDLIFIEVQTGTYFGEDDIFRYSDDYGRASSK